MPRSESSAGGLELAGHPAGGSLRLPDATLGEHHDAGYETDGTAFSDAGYTTEGNTPTSEAQGLLQGALWAASLALNTWGEQQPAHRRCQQPGRLVACTC